MSDLFVRNGEGAPPGESATFENALLELEKITSELEDGQTGLEQALKRYEEGVALLRRCYEQLRNVEQRILELTGKDEAGNPVLKPFEHSSSVKKG